MSSSSLVVAPAGSALGGRLRVPGDKSISHRALLLAALAEGRSTLRGLSRGADVAHTAAAVGRFGAVLDRREGAILVEGGRSRLHEPDRVIDVGNSGTGIRLLAGWSAGVAGLTVLEGDRSVAGRPMDRVAVPLRAMGAIVDGRGGGRFPPLVVRGGGLRGIDYRPPVASAQVKGAVLLAALAAEGPTTVREAVPTRAHTEELLALTGARLARSDGDVTVWPSPLSPFELDVPADPSQAAFWAVAGSLVASSDMVLEHVYLGPGRAGFVEALQRMGAAVTVEHHDPASATGDLRVRAAALRATRIAGAEIPSLIDELPVLAVAAAMAEGTTVIADAAELAVKESDRIATVCAGLSALGVAVEPTADGMVITGRAGKPFRAGRVDAAGDHRVAMSMAVAALVADGAVTIEGWESVATSYPSFEEDLRRCLS